MQYMHNANVKLHSVIKIVRKHEFTNIRVHIFVNPLPFVGPRWVALWFHGKENVI